MGRGQWPSLRGAASPPFVRRAIYFKDWVQAARPGPTGSVTTARPLITHSSFYQCWPEVSETGIYSGPLPPRQQHLEGQPASDDAAQMAFDGFPPLLIMHLAGCLVAGLGPKAGWVRHAGHSAGWEFYSSIGRGGASHATGDLNSGDGAIPILAPASTNYATFPVTSIKELFTFAVTFSFSDFACSATYSFGTFRLSGLSVTFGP